MINLKFCKKCGTPFDIGTNYELCLGCRHKFLKIKEKEKTKNEREEQQKLS